MEALLTTPWRTGPAWLLVLLGAWLVARAVRRWRGLPAELRDPARALAIARSGRRIILGLCVIGFGIGWMLSTEWVVLLALVILGEEMLETSTMILALRRGTESEEIA